MDKLVERMQSVSVIAATGLASDLLLTTLFVLGPDEGKEFIDILPGTSALLVSHDGKLCIYGNWSEKVVIY
jgi:thiamine biosynthesis lipoprotein ApbE